MLLFINTFLYANLSSSKLAPTRKKTVYARERQ